jgi:integrase/recombinase XerD
MRARFERRYSWMRTKVAALCARTAIPVCTIAPRWPLYVQQLADVPPEVEWFANIDNARTRRAYRIDLQDFSHFVGIHHPADFRTVTRAHLIAWRKHLEARQVSGATIRRKLAAISSLFEYLCERNAVTHNPVLGVKRPKVDLWKGTCDMTQ